MQLNEQGLQDCVLTVGGPDELDWIAVSRNHFLQDGRLNRKMADVTGAFNPKSADFPGTYNVTVLILNNLLVVFAALEEGASPRVLGKLEADHIVGIPKVRKLKRGWSKPLQQETAAGRERMDRIWGDRNRSAAFPANHYFGTLIEQGSFG